MNGMDGVAVGSAGPRIPVETICTFIPDRQSCQHLVTQILGQILLLTPNQWRQSAGKLVLLNGDYVEKLAANGNANRRCSVSRRVNDAHCCSRTGRDTRRSSISVRWRRSVNCAGHSNEHLKSCGKSRKNFIRVRFRSGKCAHY